MDTTNVTSLPMLLASIPFGLRKKTKVRQAVKEAYEYELSYMKSIANKIPTHNVHLYFGAFEPNGQSTFEVLDKELPRMDTVNWYGMNTSQWLYAGCIHVSKDGSVSRHH